MSDDAIGRAEDIWLSAESLERHLAHVEAPDDVQSAVADVVIAARELHDLLAGQESGWCLVTLDSSTNPETTHAGYAVNTHRMIPGSHERLSGPECRCGFPWDRWNDRCAKPMAGPNA